LALILAFIGVKLVLQASHEIISASVPKVHSLISLAVVVTVLTVSILLSVLRPEPSAGNEGGPR
jgi:tellurite resistance protein TerC